MGEQINNMIMKKSKYDYGHVYFDCKDPNHIWVALAYSSPRRNGKIDLKEVVKEFKSQEEMMKFFKDNFDIEYRENRLYFQGVTMFFHYVDYKRADYYKSTSMPDSNTIEVTVDEYDEFGRRKVTYDSFNRPVPKVSTLLFKPDEEEFVCRLFGYHGKISQHINSHPEIFGSYINNIDVRTSGIVKDPYRPTRMERREVERRSTFPMPKKEKIRFRWKAGLAILSAIVLGTGYSVVRDAFSNKPNVFKQKNATIFNRRDNFVRDNQRRVSEIIDKLMDKKYNELNDDDISLFSKFSNELAKGDFDNNNSSTDILYYDYFSDKYLSRCDTNKKLNFNDVNDLLKKIEEYYSKCRAYTSDGVILRTQETNKYLDFVGSLSVMKDKYPGAWNGNVPKNDDSRGNYASTKEVSIFSQLEEPLQYLILTQYQETLTNANYTVSEKDRPAYYFGATGEESKNNLLKEVKDKRASLIENIKSAYLAAKRENARRLAMASDAVVAQARLEEEQKSHGGK